MNTRDNIKKVLEEMDIHPSFDEDGDMQISINGHTIHITYCEMDCFSGVMMVMPEVYKIQPGTVAQSLMACSMVMRNMTWTKIYTDMQFTNVMASCEFFYVDDETLRLNIIMVLDILILIPGKFQEAMNDISLCKDSVNYVTS